MSNLSPSDIAQARLKEKSLNQKTKELENLESTKLLLSKLNDPSDLSKLNGIQSICSNPTCSLVFKRNIGSNVKLCLECVTYEIKALKSKISEEEEPKTSSMILKIARENLQSARERGKNISAKTSNQTQPSHPSNAQLPPSRFESLVYLLQCENNNFYIGVTDNIQTRLANHFGPCGGCKFTRNNKPDFLLGIYKVSAFIDLYNSVFNSYTCNRNHIESLITEKLFMIKEPLSNPFTSKNICGGRHIKEPVIFHHPNEFSFHFRQLELIDKCDCELPASIAYINDKFLYNCPNLNTKNFQRFTKKDYFKPCNYTKEINIEELKNKRKDVMTPTQLIYEAMEQSKLDQNDVITDSDENIIDDNNTPDEECVSNTDSLEVIVDLPEKKEECQGGIDFSESSDDDTKCELILFPGRNNTTMSRKQPGSAKKYITPSSFFPHDDSSTKNILTKKQQDESDCILVKSYIEEFKNINDKISDLKTTLTSMESKVAESKVELKPPVVKVTHRDPESKSKCDDTELLPFPGLDNSTMSRKQPKTLQNDYPLIKYLLEKEGFPDMYKFKSSFTPESVAERRFTVIFKELDTSREHDVFIEKLELTISSTDTKSLSLLNEMKFKSKTKYLKDKLDLFIKDNFESNIKILKY